jgi:hypothetical protein
MFTRCRLIFATFSCAMLLALAACGPKAGEEDAVRAVFEQVRTGDFGAVETRLSPNLATPQTRAQLEMLRRDYIPEPPTSDIVLLNWSWLAIAGGDRTITALHQYTYDDRILLVTTVMVTHSDGSINIAGFHVNRLEPSAAQDNGFTLVGKSMQQLIFVGCLAISVSLMVLAVIGTLFTKAFKRKWLWVIVSLVGAPVFVMNWATGIWEARTALGLINAGIMRGLSPLDPWIVQFHIPIGAIIVLSLLLPHWMGVAPSDQRPSVP